MFYVCIRAIVQCVLLIKSIIISAYKYIYIYKYIDMQIDEGRRHGE